VESVHSAVRTESLYKTDTLRLLIMFHFTARIWRFIQHYNATGNSRCVTSGRTRVHSNYGSLPAFSSQLMASHISWRTPLNFTLRRCPGTNWIHWRNILKYSIVSTRSGKQWRSGRPSEVNSTGRHELTNIKIWKAVTASKLATGGERQDSREDIDSERKDEFEHGNTAWVVL
jgi:hypothetical protein